MAVVASTKRAVSRKPPQPRKDRVAVYAVLREDIFLGATDGQLRVTVKEIVPTLDEAKAEVARLNALQGAGDEIRYWWQTTRWLPNGVRK
jgi:hypothetical protein